ncbi:hypothetical protein DSS3P1_16 [Ruegeria phage DSS3-P1]|uniref:hypothetical protein n=1 Tax=Ruegeria phage DSS3-P1 TaxID=1555208 RepID=UPI0002357D56|nr:hypothetical protein DSS3P1_16 [Ruegeria phage DSS3-P1]YP_009997233.1 hypothetical protein JT312_gp16 [Ruegeria phage vB_RpoS-V18]YP_009997315.1 hypothetical protein JT313_gp16 [Ruegeria phage vB_RpoS-V11]YP_009997398.1 hypothetical protein JT314_gp17 [Ruegeria phage vB_RpoS-V7]AET42320.1 hypothetical protein SDSG_00055 [Ruegeria phage DSS3-P1]AIT13251.1 hypothetical protein DSS3P1_16 [Ruegeria phage DSS3-P1]AWY08720.1 hypothetical protein vBRpoSV7_17 [Ruegeria phage vB_RpoS-V7]AWY08892.1
MIDKEKRVWRVVQTDNLNRETVAYRAVVSNLTHNQADRICAILRENCTDYGSEWYQVRHHGDRLCGGMADFI